MLVEVNCETDFVGRNAEFLGFVSQVADQVAAAAPGDVTDLKSQTVEARGISVEEILGETVAKLGENMGIARFERVEVSGTGAVMSYIHGGGKIGVLVEFGFNKPETAQTEGFEVFAKDVAMQVAAAMPQYTRREEVPADVVEHETSIYMAQAAESGKPEAIQEKMAAGRLEKFYKEVCLVEQAFVKDQNMSVTQYAQQVGKALGDELTIAGFTRWVLGESGGGE